jgi:hypothetical protein
MEKQKKYIANVTSALAAGSGAGAASGSGGGALPGGYR